MLTFLIILAGLIAFNFILLKLSVQSVDNHRKKSKNTKSSLVSNEILEKQSTTEISEAA